MGWDRFYVVNRLQETQPDQIHSARTPYLFVERESNPSNRLYRSFKVSIVYIAVARNSRNRIFAIVVNLCAFCERWAAPSLFFFSDECWMMVIYDYFSSRGRSVWRYSDFERCLPTVLASSKVEKIEFIRSSYTKTHKHTSTQTHHTKTQNTANITPEQPTSKTCIAQNH